MSFETSAALRRIEAQCTAGPVYKHVPTGKRYYLGAQVDEELELIPISGPSVYITADQLRDSDAWEKQ